jgi:predicted PurR-regulated permease PerM
MALSILLSIFLMMIIMGGLIYFFYVQILYFKDDLPVLSAKLNEKLLQIQQFIRDEFNISEKSQNLWLQQKAQSAEGSSEKILVNLFAFTGSFLANLALIPVYIFFLTLFKEKYKAFILMISSPENHVNILGIVKQITMVSQKYLKGMLIDVAILSVLNSAGFLMLGIEHAILFGVLASILNIIPYVGVLIGSLLPITMALLTMDSIMYAVGVAAVCMIVQFIDNNIINPYVVGSSVSINPLTATLALVAGALIWGVAGMILSIPLMGMIKVVCDNVPQLKPVGFLIGEERTYNHEDLYAERILKSFRRNKSDKPQ